ncbi:HDOD domain-containing protein [Neptuniibacter sp. CAU 1671]|uniref:HDOD domain-containing protein n=1 Tax=Neptuniibacter sp. CAU 1671 TaxID=3032593 RepID=UPI0023DC84A8|nr:HDOD domain-containing protein [Neptuniibacter sp. CAU 1671]MDF2182809.1 HDOD domain-containing protein [Neptuniibacter sp. CAU 1671]
MINPGEIDQQKLGSGFIPPKPEILLKIQKLINENADIVEIATLLARDPGLSSAVITHINSAIFFMQRKVSDIRQAVILLGANRVERLCYYYSLRKSLEGESCISMERFWATAEKVARGCYLFGKTLDLKVPEEDLYSAGLFHDCGIAIMARNHPSYIDVLNEANRTVDVPMTDVEKRYFSYHHSIIGYMLAENWGLPEPICQVILQNHEYDVQSSPLPAPIVKLIAALKCAENAVEMGQRNHPLSDWDKHLVWILPAIGCTEERLNEITALVIEDLKQF